MKKLFATTSILSTAAVIILTGTIALLAQERRTGAISVRCRQPGAEVFLDGVSHGGAPVVINSVTAGNHQLVVIAPGMDAHVETVRVRPGVTVRVRVQLRPLSGSIAVTTEPPGAKVSIDGREAGTSPVEIGNVACGKHVVSAARPGFATREKEINIEYGEELSIFLRMKVKQRVFSIFSFPSGAEVFLDAKLVGVTPLKLSNVAPGKHKLRVVKEKGCVHEETVTVHAEKDLALDITLPVPGAILSLDPGPAGRKLYLDGHLFAQLKARKIIVPPGEHVIKVTGWKGTLLYQRRLKLEKGKTFKVEIKPGFEFRSQLKGHTQTVLALTFAPGGATLASASKDGTIRLWDLERKKEFLSIDAHPTGVQAVSFDPQGKQIASGGWDNAVRVWDASTGKKLKEFELKSPVHAMAWSPDGQYVAAGCGDGTLRIWAVNEGWKETALRGHGDRVHSLAFNPKGSVLISGGADGAVIFWKVSDGSQAGKLTETSPVKALSVSRDGESVAIGCKDGQVRLRELESKKRLRVTKVQPNWVLSLAAGWGSVFAAGGDGEKVTILGAAAGKLLELKELKVSATALAFEGRGRYLAAGSSGGVIYFWLAE